MRRATIRTRHDDASIIAEAIRPDNTDEMRTSVGDDEIETSIERESTGGLRTTIDDYVVNLQVAEAVVNQTEAKPSPQTNPERYDNE